MKNDIFTLLFLVNFIFSAQAMEELAGCDMDSGAETQITPNNIIKYEEISVSYAQITIDHLAKLWLHLIFTPFSSETQPTTLKDSENITKMMKWIKKSPSRTYQILKNLDEIKQKDYQIQPLQFKDRNKVLFIQKYRKLLGDLSCIYQKIIE